MTQKNKKELSYFRLKLENYMSEHWKIQCKMPPKTKRFYPLVPK